MTHSGVTDFSCFCQEKELLKKKQEEMEEAERAKRNRVVVTFDLVGRKVYFFAIMLNFKLKSLLIQFAAA